MKTLNDAIWLRENDRVAEALDILKELLSRNPEDPNVNYQYAWCCDLLGDEREAIPYYLNALNYGLKGKDRKEAFLGLGSTYRTIGEYEKSESTLLEALEEFNDNSLRVFLSMTYYNLGKHEEAMEILLTLMADTSSDISIRQFEKAIRYYSDKLNRLW